MAEQLRSTPDKLNIIKRTLVLGIPALVLSACATNAEDRAENTSPADRYSYDYLLSSRQDNGTTWCLEDTPYSKDRTIISQFGEDGVKVTPTNSELTPLEFTGIDDYSKPLQPADDYTSAMLESYGCDTEADGDRNVNHF